MKIVVDLKEDIFSKRLVPGDKIPTEQELAGKYKVSRITTTRAIRELESEGLLYRVKGSGTFVKEEADWGVNKTRSRFISLILPFARQTGGGYLLLDGAESQAKTERHLLTIHNSEMSCANERDIILDLLEHNSQGMVFYPSSCLENYSILSRLIVDHIPLVIIDRKVIGIDASYIGADNTPAIVNMIDYLAGLGHRRIAYVGNSRRGSTSETERFIGYCKGLVSHRIPIRREYVFISDEEHDGEAVMQDAGIDPWTDMDASLLVSARALDAFMSLSEPPTALVAVNDLAAVSLLKAALKKGIAIPERLSLTGFDDLPMVSHVEVPLTTISQPFFDIGAKAVRVLQNLIKNPDAPKEELLLPTRLVVRESTSGPIKS